MTSKQYTSFFRSILLASAVYMMFESIYHFSGIRLSGTEKVWPESAIIFIRLFMWLWASASFFLALVLFFSYRYFEHAKPLLKLLLFPSFLHVGVLLWLSLTPYASILPLPNLYFWTPLYSWGLRGEALAVLIGGSFIVYGMHKKYL